MLNFRGVNQKKSAPLIANLVPFGDHHSGGRKRPPHLNPLRGTEGFSPCCRCGTVIGDPFFRALDLFTWNILGDRLIPEQPLWG